MINQVSKLCGHIAAFLLLIAAVLVFAIVILRYIFDMGWVALQETALYLHAISFLLALTYALNEDAHVRVDIFYEKMTAKNQHWSNLFGTIFLMLPVMGTLLYVTYPYVRDSWSSLEASADAGGLPLVFLIKSFLMLFPLLLIVESLRLATNSLKGLRRG